MSVVRSRSTRRVQTRRVTDRLQTNIHMREGKGTHHHTQLKRQKESISNLFSSSHFPTPNPSRASDVTKEKKMPKKFNFIALYMAKQSFIAGRKVNIDKKHERKIQFSMILVTL